MACCVFSFVFMVIFVVTIFLYVCGVHLLFEGLRGPCAVSGMKTRVCQVQGKLLNPYTISVALWKLTLDFRLLRDG